MACPSQKSCASCPSLTADSPLAWFAKMVSHAHGYAAEAHAAGRPVVGILCEFTPRELILAAGGVPVCLCGGDAKMIPAAEEVLPANLCPLIKSTFGYHLLRANPFLEMASLVVAETTCDGKKKMYEIMAETRPMFVLELPQREHDEAGLFHWEAELRRLVTELEQRFGVAITTARLREAIKLMNRERGLRRRLAALMKVDPPPLTGRELLDFKSLISGIPSDLEQYERALAAWEGRLGRADLAGRVRVLLTGVPAVHGAEKVVDLVEDHGGLIVAMESCTGLKPILDDVDESAEDPLHAVAEKYAHLPCSVMTPNARRLDSLRQLAPEFSVECVVELVWQACLTYDVESHRVRRLVETELGLPYLRIETDYAPGDAARIALRLDAVYEMARSRREHRP